VTKFIVESIQAYTST